MAKLDFTAVKVRAIRLPALYDKLTPAERVQVRDQYVERQKGLCWYCKAPLEGSHILEVDKKVLVREYPPDFFKYRVHLHHNHVTGKTLGAVHNRCNAVLFEYHGE
jgi:hypothetical protein